MARTKVPVPDAWINSLPTTVVNAVCDIGGFQTGQGLTKNQFVKHFIGATLIDLVRQNAVRGAADTARDEAGRSVTRDFEVS